VTVRTLLSTAVAQFLINYQNTSGETVLYSRSPCCGFESWSNSGYEVEPTSCQCSLLETYGQWTLDFPTTDHTVRGLPDVGHPRSGSLSVSTVTELIFVRSQRLTNFVIKEIYTLWTTIANLKSKLLLSSCCPKSANRFYGKFGKTMTSHKCPF
jgi:hypothetical protein